MAAVAAVALALAVVRFVLELRYYTFQNGWNTSVFAVGERVAPIVDVRIGPSLLPAGGPCLVVDDPTDDDSAYPTREVKVRVEDRAQDGPIMNVRRIDLRAR